MVLTLPSVFWARGRRPPCCTCRDFPAPSVRNSAHWVRPRRWFTSRSRLRLLSIRCARVWSARRRLPCLSKRRHSRETTVKRLFVVPGQRRIHAAGGQSIELSLPQLAKLHGVAPVAEVR